MEETIDRYHNAFGVMRYHFIHQRDILPHVRVLGIVNGQLLISEFPIKTTEDIKRKRVEPSKKN